MEIPPQEHHLHGVLAPPPRNGAPPSIMEIADAIMDGILHNACIISMGGNISMGKRHGLNLLDDDGTESFGFSSFFAVFIRFSTMLSHLLWR